MPGHQPSAATPDSSKIKTSEARRRMGAIDPSRRTRYTRGQDFQCDPIRVTTLSHARVLTSPRASIDPSRRTRYTRGRDFQCDPIRVTTLPRARVLTNPASLKRYARVYHVREVVDAIRSHSKRRKTTRRGKFYLRWVDQYFFDFPVYTGNLEKQRSEAHPV